MKTIIMKLLNEGEFDSYVNMGNMGTEQEMNTNEEQGYDDDRGRAYREIGALSVLVANGIQGRLMGEAGLQSVMESESLSNKTKEDIKKMVQEGVGSVLGLNADKSKDIPDFNVGDQNELMESAKENLKKQFKRLIRG